jgi:hypothetical protein
MDNILSLITHDELEKLVTGSFDLRNVPPEKHKGVLLIVAHCCLNGPVGTNKTTTFPIIGGPFSVSEFCGFRVSNNSWKEFCKKVAILHKSNFPEICQRCQQMTVSGDLWPLAPSISEIKNKS